jgi:hypothetical protein
VLVAAALLGALTAWLGTRVASVPTATDEATTVIPLWRLLAMGAAVLPVLAVHSRLADLEVVATRRLRLYQRAYLCAMSAAGATIYFGLSAITLPPDVLATIGRSWLGWCGLALLAGALLGWRLAWTLPVTAGVVLAYWGHRGGEQYQWWEFSARPPDDLPSLLLSLTLLSCGLAAYWATPWRRRRFTVRR